jgi:hypothetical protein
MIRIILVTILIVIFLATWAVWHLWNETKKAALWWIKGEDEPF